MSKDPFDELEKIDLGDILLYLGVSYGEYGEEDAKKAKETALRRYGSPEKAIAALEKRTDLGYDEIEKAVLSFANNYGPDLLALQELKDEHGEPQDKEEDDSEEDDES